MSMIDLNLIAAYKSSISISGLPFDFSVSHHKKRCMNSRSGPEKDHKTLEIDARSFVIKNATKILNISMAPDSPNSEVT
jgi:hypothetical protein